MKIRNSTPKKDIFIEFNKQVYRTTVYIMAQFQNYIFIRFEIAVIKLTFLSKETNKTMIYNYEFYDIMNFKLAMIFTLIKLWVHSAESLMLKAVKT